MSMNLENFSVSLKSDEKNRIFSNSYEKHSTVSVSQIFPLKSYLQVISRFSHPIDVATQKKLADKIEPTTIDIDMIDFLCIRLCDKAL